MIKETILTDQDWEDIDMSENGWEYINYNVLQDGSNWLFKDDAFKDFDYFSFHYHENRQLLVARHGEDYDVDVHQNIPRCSLKDEIELVIIDLIWGWANSKVYIKIQGGENV